MKRYIGIRDPDDALENEVYIETSRGERKELPLCLNLRNHSPTGFEWGYMGSGPAQLSLAILDDLFGSAFALKHYMRFKFEVVGKLRREGWTLTEETIRRLTNGW